ncbi:hypothetical protein [Mycobacterium sp. NPDC050853]|uniref:hypothetical protein n=1 Tax=Mycobacterium sp. NPDC050853 TaxID=3155160 RepID=UPI0033C3A921
MSSAPWPGDLGERRARLLGASAGLGWESAAAVLDASILDVTADLAVVVDEPEQARRAATAADRLDDFDVLMFLMGLPQFEPVPLHSLNPDERATLQHAPAGSVDVSAESVTRLACPPTQSVLAVVYDHNWRRGLRAASVFAPVATRMLVLPTLPPDAALDLAEAAEYGIGVGTSAGDSIDVHVPPARWRQQYFTPGGWLFREQVFELAAAQNADFTTRG